MVGRKWSVTAREHGVSSGSTLATILLVGLASLPLPVGGSALPGPGAGRGWVASPSTPVNNFTASINRLVDLVALAGSGILSLVWARVAMSWFSNDITKKIQAKDRARDALIGTLLFMAAITGLLYGLAHWVLTGS